MTCPIRKQLLIEKRKGKPKATYSAVAGLRDCTAYPDVFKDSTGKSVSCIFLAILKNDERPGTFNDTLNELLLLNGLPSLKFGDYTPPSSRIFMKSGLDDRVDGGQDEVDDPSSVLVT
jgi:hypothetical protein